MNYKSKPDLMHKKKYQSYYLKKLQTQSSADDLNNKSLSQTSDILEKQIEKMEKSLFNKNSLYVKTLKRKNQIDNQLQKSRSQLKSRIQQKMRKSQQNLLSYRQKSNSSLSSRLKAQAKKIEEIKNLQKTFYNQTYVKSKEMSTKTQKFFQTLADKKKIKSNRNTLNNSQIRPVKHKQHLFEPISTKNIKMNTSKNISLQSSTINPQKTYFPLTRICTTRQSIEMKQKKKIDLQKAKQDSFIQQYASKMQNIVMARKRSHVQKKVPQSTVSKFAKRQDYEDKVQQRKKFSKSFVSQAVTTKGLFSQLYEKKLKQKKQRTQFFLSQSLADGDLILKGSIKNTSKLKLNKLIRQTQNQLARKQNFRYMQKYLNKRF